MSGFVVVLEDGVEREGGVIPVALDSPLWTRGQSLFETVLVWPAGTWGLYRAVDHAGRLARAAADLKWEGVPGVERMCEWMRLAARLFRARHPGFGRLRLTVAWTRSEGPASTFVTVVPYERPLGPVRAVTTPVRLPWAEGFTTPKSGSRAPYALAESLAAAAGCDEGLLLDAEGRPAEGARSNLFALRGMELRTPPVGSGALPGITRARVLELAGEMGLRVREAPLDREWLSGADTLFLTNALWGVRPVAELDGVALGDPHPWALRLRAAYEADVRAHLREE